MLKRAPPLPGYSNTSAGVSPEDMAISGVTGCIFKVEIEAGKLFAKFVHSPFGTVDKIAGI